MATTNQDKSRLLKMCKLRVQGQMPLWSMWIYSGGGVNYVPPGDLQYDTVNKAVALTDGSSVWVSDSFMALAPKEQDFALVHELVHKQNCHPLRLKAAHRSGQFGGLPFVEGIFRHVVELWTNATTIASGIGAIPRLEGMQRTIDRTVSYKDNLVDLYRRFYEKQESSGGQGQGEGQGQGDSEGQPKPDTAGDGPGLQGDLKEPEGPADRTTVERAEAEQRTMIKAAIQAAKTCGKRSNEFERWLAEQAEPKVDWRQVLAALFRPWVGREKLDFTRMNRNRFIRSGGLIISPSRRGVRMNKLVCFYDTSGSIGEQEIKQFNGELVGILQDVRPQEIIVAGIDAVEPKKWVSISQVEELNDIAPAIIGGGGTDFRPAFKWVEKQDLQPDAVVYFTDLHGPWPSEPPPYPVFWACTTDQVCPWGDTVKIDLTREP